MKNLCKTCKWYSELQLEGLENPQRFCHKPYNHHYTTPEEEACEYYEVRNDQ